MKKLTLIVALLTVFAGGASATHNGTLEGQEKKTLYVRLGGYDAIAAVTDDFIGRLVTDKKLGRFFSSPQSGEMFMGCVIPQIRFASSEMHGHLA